MILTPVLKGQSLKICIFPNFLRVIDGLRGTCEGLKITMYIRGLPKNRIFQRPRNVREALSHKGFRRFDDRDPEGIPKTIYILTQNVYSFPKKHSCGAIIYIVFLENKVLSFSPP